MLFAFALIAVGYATTYYGANVLVWAHFSTATEEPVTYGACLGLSVGARATPFMPPATLGIAIPGAITDARGLLGGTPSTGAYQQVSATAPAGPAGGSGGGGGPTTSGGTPLNTPSASGGKSPKPGDANFVGPISAAQRPFVPDNVTGGFRDATPGEIAKSRLNPPPPGRKWVTDGNGGFTLG